MGFIDLLTLVLVLAAGFQVGAQAFFGFDPAMAIFGSGGKFVLMAMGASALWQLVRNIRNAM
jgi:uncharacterized membrane protein YuzA (DUF378 family)